MDLTKAQLHVSQINKTVAELNALMNQAVADGMLITVNFHHIGVIGLRSAIPVIEAEVTVNSDVLVSPNGR